MACLIFLGNYSLEINIPKYGSPWPQQVKTSAGNETIMTELTDICKDKLGKQVTQ